MTASYNNFISLDEMFQNVIKKGSCFKEVLTLLQLLVIRNFILQLHVSRLSDQHRLLC